MTPDLPKSVQMIKNAYPVTALDFPGLSPQLETFAKRMASDVIPGYQSACAIDLFSFAPEEKLVLHVMVECNTVVSEGAPASPLGLIRNFAVGENRGLRLDKRSTELLWLMHQADSVDFYQTGQIFNIFMVVDLAIIEKGYDNRPR